MLLHPQLILAYHRTDTPRRHLVRIGFALEHDERGIVLRALFRVDAKPVREVQQSAQMAERALAVQTVNVLENRPKVGRRLPDELKMFHVIRKLTGVCHLFVRAELIVAL